MMGKAVIVHAASATADDNGNGSLLYCYLFFIIIVSLTIGPDSWHGFSRFSNGFLSHLKFIHSLVMWLVVALEWYLIWPSAAPVLHCSAIVVWILFSICALLWVRVPMGWLQGVSTKSIIKVHSHENKMERRCQLINLNIYWPPTMQWALCWGYIDEQEQSQYPAGRRDQ